MPPKTQTPLLAAVMTLLVAGCSGAPTSVAGRSAPGGRAAPALPAGPTQPFAARGQAEESDLSALAAGSPAREFLPLPARAAYPSPCPPPPLPPRPPRPPAPPRVPKVAESAVPRPVAVGPRRPSLVAAGGKGTWAVYFNGRGINGQALANKAKAAGLDSIWVRTGGSRQHRYYGDEVLKAVLVPAHRAGLKVIAWDFPSLSEPAVDAYRARRALAFRIRGQRIDGFSPDIETKAEGVFATPRRVAFYLSVVRRAAGNRPVITTVPRPTPKRLRTFPYRAVAAGSDALAPMVYWSCAEPGKSVAAAMDGLAPFARPVHVIGQGYDMASEAGRHGLPTAGETWRFIDVAHRRGAVGVSLYQVSTAGAGQQRALSAYPWSSSR